MSSVLAGTTQPDSPKRQERLHAALQRGIDAAANEVSQWQGPFAASVHDAVSGASFGVVDRFSAQTLCWRQDGAEIRFAPSAVELAGPTPELDPQAIFEYLYFHFVPSPRTIFRGVQRVPAAHHVATQGSDAFVAPYWRPRFGPTRSGPFAELRKEFLGLMKSAVTRCVHVTPQACFLSGGTDSSSVAGFIREVTGQGAVAYSIGFDAAGYDEMSYARIAAQHFGCEHREYYITPDDLVRGIPEVAASFDQPFGNSSVLPSYYCALQARKDGHRFMLAGDGGDELFGGNARYAKQRLFGVYNRVPHALRAAVIEPICGSKVLADLPGLRKVASYVEQARVPMPDRLEMYNLLLRLGVDKVLEPGFRAQLDADGPRRHQREVWGWAEKAEDLNRTLAYDWRYTLGENDLPKVRSAAQLAGVSVEYPMLDVDLLEFSMRLPDSYKLRGLRLRWFFKEALRGFLPDSIIDKPKHGFGLPFGPWLQTHEGLRALAKDALGSLGTRGIVRPGFLIELMGQRLAQHPGYYGEMVWVLMMLEHWIRSHAADASFRG